eukprot:GHVU01081767.1.p3 GENE.GHVU01081767.1~~GHVU01081767.1.p3  ORF type:complete len:171 (-),score=40.11 GHVU01081767.1:187-699(-)
MEAVCRYVDAVQRDADDTLVVYGRYIETKHMVPRGSTPDRESKVAAFVEENRYPLVKIVDYPQFLEMKSSSKVPIVMLCVNANKQPQLQSAAQDLLPTAHRMIGKYRFVVAKGAEFETALAEYGVTLQSLPQVVVINPTSGNTFIDPTRINMHRLEEALRRSLPINHPGD